MVRQNLAQQGNGSRQAFVAAVGHAPDLVDQRLTAHDLAVARGQGEQDLHGLGLDLVARATDIDTVVRHVDDHIPETQGLSAARRSHSVDLSEGLTRSASLIASERWRNHSRPQYEEPSLWTNCHLPSTIAALRSSSGYSAMSPGKRSPISR